MAVLLTLTRFAAVADEDSSIFRKIAVIKKAGRGYFSADAV